jgi:alditol oxidase
MVFTNWSRTVTFSSEQLHRPRSVEELQAIVAASDSCRVLGSAHSFSRVADTTGDLISLEALPTRLEINGARTTVTVSAGTRYGELAVALEREGLALHNLASLPHITVAGSCATGTHGSGVANGPLSSAVRAIEFVAASGELVTMRIGDADFHGAVVSLGALGAVVSMTLAVEPTYQVAQQVFTDLPMGAAMDQLDRWLSMAYSVSLFTTWGDDVVDQVWVKARLDQPPPATDLLLRAGARQATTQLHPVPSMNAAACTPQQGIAGPWQERLPHFALAFTPSAGDEIQSEFFVDRSVATSALAALRAIASLLRGPLMVSEIRAVAADDQWLSMSHARDSVAFHFTWCSDAERVMPAVAAVERALEPFAPRPHWGKVTSIDPSAVRSLYPRWADARDLVRRVDPEGVFANDFTRALFASP